MIIHGKAIEQYVLVVLFVSLYSTIVTFESADKFAMFLVRDVQQFFSVVKVETRV